MNDLFGSPSRAGPLIAPAGNKPMDPFLKQFSNNTSKALVLATLVLTGCCMVSAFLPVFGFIVFLLLPAVSLFFRSRMERQDAILSILLAWLATGLFSGTGFSADTLMMLAMMALGLFMAEWLEKKAPVEMVIGCSSALVLGLAIVLLTAYGTLSGTGMIQIISEYIRTNLDMTISAYRQLGISDDRVAAISNAKDQIHYVLLRIFPGITASGLMLSAWLNLLAAREAFRRAGLPFPGQWHLNQWKTPDFLVWGFAACLLMLLLPSSLPRFIGVNGLLCLMAIYLMQGIAIISFYFNLKNIPRFLRVTVYVLIGIQQIFLICVIGLGFLDTWIDFRKTGHTEQT